MRFPQALVAIGALLAAFGCSHLGGDQVMLPVVVGMTDATPPVVTLDEALLRVGSETRLKTVAMHELLHAIDSSYGFGLPEATVYGLAEALVDTMQRNHLDFLA